MEYKYKLSIIIPMYNAEKYIGNCLDSILNSDLPKGEYEVIIINDGSIDNGPQITQEYVSKHDNFVYLSQENQGQSVARNKGFEVSRGEYLWCVDSDDVVCSDLVFIYDFLKNTPDADIIKTKILTFDEGQIVSYKQLDGTYTHKTGKELLLEGFHPASLCSMIVRKSLLDNYSLRLIPGIVNEDVELSHRVYAYANSVYTFNYITYLYLHNSSSTTQSKDCEKVIKRCLSDITISKSFCEFSININDTELSKFFYNQSNSILLGSLLTMIRKRKERGGTGINQKVLEEMKKQGVYPLEGKFDSFKKTAVVIILNMEPLLRRII